MTFTTGKLFFLLFLLLFINNSLYSAKIDFIYDNNTINIKLILIKEFSIQEYKKEGKIFYVKLKTNEPLDNITKEFWGYSIERISVTHDGKNYLINFEFIDDAYEAELKRSGNLLYVTFKTKPEPVNVGSTAGRLYFRAFIGLAIILIFILIVFWLIKLIYRGKIISVIPGVGRILGKIDLAPGRSLYFYELGIHIYILAVAGNNLNLIDKIENIEVINIIKEGFAKRKDFSSYLRFFGKKTLNEDINITKTILEEKIDTLRKK
jgi:flagellar biogenesis protein FliO